MHAGLVLRVGRRAAEASLALLGSPSQVAIEDRKLELERGKAVRTLHMAAPFPVCPAQTPAAIKCDKDGGLFPLWAICLVLYREGHKGGNWFISSFEGKQNKANQNKNCSEISAFHIWTWVFAFSGNSASCLDSQLWKFLLSSNGPFYSGQWVKMIEALKNFFFCPRTRPLCLLRQYKG